MNDDLLTRFLDSDMFAMIFYALLILLFVYGDKVKLYIYEKYNKLNRINKYLLFIISILSIVFVNFSYYNGYIHNFLTDIMNFILIIILLSQLKISYKHLKKDKQSILSKDLKDGL